MTNTSSSMSTGVGYRAAAVVLAAGSGTRMRAEQNKVFLHLCGRRVVSWSIESLARIRAVERMIMVIREQDRAIANETLDREIDDPRVEIVVGGSTRQESELLALRHLGPAITSGEINLVLIHDGARPILSPTLVNTLLRNAFEHDAAYPAVETDDIRRMKPDGTIDMLNTEVMLRVQTPQAFRAQPLLDCYERAEVEGFDGPDTVACWENYHHHNVPWVPGDPRNIKITYPQDLFEAEKFLREAQFELK